MKKRIVCLLAIGAMLLSGCGIRGDITVNEDGTYTTVSKMYLNEAEIAELSSEEYGMSGSLSLDQATDVYEWNGVKYYGFADEDSASGITETLTEEDYGLTKGGFFIDMAVANEEDVASVEEALEMYEFIDMTITFPEEMSVANVKLSDDKKTVYLSKDDYTKFAKLYAFSADAIANDKKGPGVINADNGSKIKNNKKYKSGLRLQFVDNATGIKSSKLDGKNVKNGITVKKKGTHKLVLEDYAGNKSTIKFTIKK